MKKLIIVFLCLFLLTGCTSSKNYSSDDYTVLQEKYDSVSARLDDVSQDLEKAESKLNRIYVDFTSIENDLITLSCYFEKEAGVTFADGSSAINNIRNILDKYY